MVYLSLGLGIILLFIGSKLVFEALHHYEINEVLGISIPNINLETSLLVIVLVLSVTTIASLIKRQKPHYPL